MSSMGSRRESLPKALPKSLIARASVIAIACCGLSAVPAIAQDGGTAETFGQIQWNPSDWDKARMRNMASRPGPMTYAVTRWNQLIAQNGGSFEEYAGFISQYPGFPRQDYLQGKAEAALADKYVEPGRLVAFFDKYPPQTNVARAQYALALRALNRPEAGKIAFEAWRGGSMSPVAEATLASMFGAQFSQADHETRMNELLWQADVEGAQRQIMRVSGPSRGLLMARLSALQGQDPLSVGLSVPVTAGSDPGWLYNRVRQLRTSGQGAVARSLIANTPAFSHLPNDQEAFVTEMRLQANDALTMGDVGTAVRIARRATQAFAPDADVSKLSSKIRDDYEKLFYPIGEAALARGDARSAADMFEIYGKSQRTAPARTKGFYFAGLAADRANAQDVARRNYEAAAAYPDQFYGQLALEKLGRPLEVPAGVLPTPSIAARSAFNARPLVQAAREVGRVGDWRTAVYFFRELGQQAETAEDFALIAELARETGRRDLGVIAGREASTGKFYAFSTYAFPRIDVPTGTDNAWSMIHAISRQESQFATDAQSHAGARGLMQLMPGTAQEQAGKMYLSYNRDSLIADPQYNMRLGAGYFSRMMDVFGGSYPLAVAAYNAGPGNVGKWLRANGDPRKGEIGWVEWIEQIPFTETRRYVARVLENAAYYDALYPGSGNRSGQYPLSYYLGKRPGQ
ncbi:lytic transglycosylase domain-containing protein [Croceicoccus bisphenolivorans]|uniref:lytic transglycosylase domain-containing protein n=1 Tax=Croceicoccus bisphenolivorans TaxID=1783232 RepID=UPI000A415C2E|nr:lytic transglycosylase domain-containing protein [Croceicoccus bisphenolivorans]